jgi:hypothetical protein
MVEIDLKPNKRGNEGFTSFLYHINHDSSAFTNFNHDTTKAKSNTAHHHSSTSGNVTRHFKITVTLKLLQFTFSDKLTAC